MKGYYYFNDHAPFLPHAHYLGSSRYLDEDPKQPILGEPYGAKRKSTNGLLAVPIPPAIVVGRGRGDMTGQYPQDVTDTPMLAGIDVRCWLDSGLPPPIWIAPMRSSHTLAMFDIETGSLTNSPLSLRDDGVVVVAGCIEWDCVRWVVSAPPAPAEGVTRLYLSAHGQLRAVEPGGADTPLGYYAVSEHVADSDPHPQYALDSDLAGYLTTSAAAAAYQPLDSDLTAIAALSTTSVGRSLLAGADAAALRTILSLGSAAVSATSDFDAAGAGTAAVAAHEALSDPHPQYALDTDLASYLTTSAAAAAYQPLDSDLTAIAALTTTSIGRSLLAGANAAALRTILALGSAAVSATSDFDAAGAGTAAVAAHEALSDPHPQYALDSDLAAYATILYVGTATTAAIGAHLTDTDPHPQYTTASELSLAITTALTPYLDAAALAAAYQPLDSDLTAIAALTTTSIGRSLLAAANAAALRTILALGSAAVNNTGDFDAAGVSAADIAAHLAASDPHPQYALDTDLAGYLTTSAAAAAYQPLDSDLTAIAALTTTSIGRSLLAAANAAALRTILALGTMATETASDYATAAFISATYLTTAGAVLAYQPVDADLTALAAISTAGLLAHTGAGTAAARSLAVSGDGLSLTNADGSGGNPTVALAAMVAAGGSHKGGAVGDPGATAHTHQSRYWGDDAAFHIPLGHILAYDLTATSETTTSGTAANLATTQTLSFTLDQTSDVWVRVTSRCANSGANVNSLWLSTDGGAAVRIANPNLTAGTNWHIAQDWLLSGLLSGAHTITLQFSVSAGTGTFSNRSIIAILAS